MIIHLYGICLTVLLTFVIHWLLGSSTRTIVAYVATSCFLYIQFQLIWDWVARMNKEDKEGDG